MQWYITAAVFAGVLVGVGGIYLGVRSRIRRFSRDVFGTPSLLDGLKEIDSTHNTHPRSLNGCDALLLPRILKDFPDFDANQAKILARDFLKEKLSEKEELTIYNIVFAKYLRSAAQKTIVMQAAVSYLENEQTAQKRYDLHYSFLLNSSDPSVAANCPNCGGAIGYGEVECPYCGCRVVNVLGNTWQFSSFTET